MNADAEVVKTEEVASEDLQTSDNPDSLAGIIERSKIEFSGHPAEGGEEPPEETRTDGEDPPEPPEPEKKFKYASHEEAEKGAAETQRFATEKAEEAKTARERAEALERELAEVRAAPPEPAEAPKPPTRVEAKGRVATALKTIRQLDEDDPEYDDKVADAWAEAGVGGPQVPVPDTAEITKIVTKQVKEELQAARDVVAAKEAESETIRIRTTATELATKSGLDMETGSADHRLFWDVAREIPATNPELEAKPLKEQTEWVVNEVRRLTGKVIETKAQRDERARQHQAQNTPLGRGSTRPQTTSTKQEPATLGNILENQRAARRI